METKKNRPPNLSLKPEKDGKKDESSGSPDCNANIQSLKEMDKLGNLKVPVSPLSKRWFRKQFGIRKDGARLQDDGAKLQAPINNATFQKSRRRSSSLPDLAAMLDAASLKRHASLRTQSPGPTRMVPFRKEPILTK